MRNFLTTTAIIAGLCLGPVTATAETLSTEIADNIPDAEINYELTELAVGLQSPYGIAFLPNGNMLVTEKDGHLRLIRNDRLVEGGVDGMPEVYFKSQAGLFDVVLHPNFAENNSLYLTYAHKEGDKNTLRFARATYVEGDGAGALENFEVLFTADAWRDTNHHYGGKLIFLSDGTMLLSSGEGSRYREEAQKLNTHYGKILRFNDDGTVPEDNPFVGQKDAFPEIWSYGHRNPQGLIYDAKNDIVYSHEHGPRGGDEVNIIEKGINYGWPVISYGIDYSGAIITPFNKMNGMRQSEVHYVPSIAPSGMTMYNGDKFQDWQGDLFIGALAHQHVRRIDMQDGNFGPQEKLFSELGQRVRDVRTGPDGYLYVLTDRKEGKVIRVSPK